MLWECELGRVGFHLAGEYSEFHFHCIFHRKLCLIEIKRQDFGVYETCWTVSSLLLIDMQYCNVKIM